MFRVTSLRLGVRLTCTIGLRVKPGTGRGGGGSSGRSESSDSEASSSLALNFKFTGKGQLELVASNSDTRAWPGTGSRPGVNLMLELSESALPATRVGATGNLNWTYS